MKQLIIVGAGGYGREISTLSKTCKGYNKDFSVKGFLDSNLNALDQFSGYPPILGDIGTYTIEADDVFVIAISDIVSKKRCLNALNEEGASFISIIDESAVIADGVKLGEGCIIGRGCIISNNVTIGNHVVFNSKAMVGHDVKIGDLCCINAGAFFGGFSVAAEECTVHTYAIVTPSIVLGFGSTVGAGSVVLKDVNKNVTVFGNPARPIFTKER